MWRIVPPVCLAATLALAATAEAATPTRTPTALPALVDAAHARSKVVAASPTPTRTPPRSSPITATRSAQQSPPTTTPTPTRTVAPAQPTATGTTTRPPATATPRQPTPGVQGAEPPGGASRAGGRERAPGGAGAQPPSPTPSPTERASATATAQPTATPIHLPTLPRTHQAVRGWQEASLLVLDVPIRSQLDGSEYQAANCGPASLAMVLEAFDVEARTPLLRNYANLLQGTYGRDDGVALDHLATIAAEAGLRSLGLRDAWSVDAVRQQLRQGHPVITLVKMRLLPDHAGSRPETDHYVVVVGLDGDDLLINDPALPGERGFRRRLTAEQLEAAWAASSIPRHGLAIAAADGVPELRFGEPAPPATATPPPTVSAPATASAAAQPIVVVITPAPPPVIVLNVPSMPQAQTVSLAMPTPLPERWARPGRIDPALATPIPDALAPRQEAVVLGEAMPAGADPVTRWLLRLGLVAWAASSLRRLLR